MKPFLTGLLFASPVALQPAEPLRFPTDNE